MEAVVMLAVVVGSDEMAPVVVVPQPLWVLGKSLRVWLRV